MELLIYFSNLQLLEKEPRSRLGVRDCKHGEVADQPFFKSIDFDKLERKQLIPPFKPNLVSTHSWYKSHFSIKSIFSSLWLILVRFIRSVKFIKSSAFAYFSILE